MDLEKYFEVFRKNTIGYDAVIQTPYGKKPLHYLDYTASGRLYKPIEEKISDVFGPLVGNTHSETNETGIAMTHAYHYAKNIIRKHVNAHDSDVVITTGFGMTGAVNKLQRLLGLKGPCTKHPEDRPVIFVTHMEHHSNHISWLETKAEVVVIEPNENTLIDLDHLEQLLIKYKDRPCKIGSFTACSNVSGIQTPYHEMAKIMHKYGGLCFVDFAASAPYVSIDMHPKDEAEKLDAIYFSPHKFLGGPGSSGVLVFDASLVTNTIPDQPGGGTVDWTNPWGGFKYVDDIESREDGGTPGFLQAIRTALAIKLKDQMGIENMTEREEQLMHILFGELADVEGLEILAGDVKKRLGILSFYAHGIHYNLFVRLLNDRYGIQARGGCSCAGTYGHYLLHIDQERSAAITELISHGDLSKKPGWVRISVHPMMTDDEVLYTARAIKEIIQNIEDWKDDYYYISEKNHFEHKERPLTIPVEELFELD